MGKFPSVYRFIDWVVLQVYSGAFQLHWVYSAECRNDLDSDLQRKWKAKSVTYFKSLYHIQRIDYTNPGKVGHKGLIQAEIKTRDLLNSKDE